MKELLQYIEELLSKRFNQSIQIKNYEQVFGGEINQTFKLQTNIHSFFLKLNKKSFDDMFEKEFDGLKLLHQINCIKIPQPMLHGKFQEQIFLVTEFIQKENQSKNFWQTFGQQLAALHKNTNEQFGLSTNNYIGSLHQQNNFCNTWPAFYTSQRLMPLAEKAFNQYKLSQTEIKQLENLCKRLYHIFPAERPALIHGDLWYGNFMSDENGEPVIYDPAVYYGHREMDIAMSLLFDGFDTNFYNFYNEAFPLQPGWKERVKLCQLYYLLVHLLLFGSGYYNSIKSIINEYR